MVAVLQAYDPAADWPEPDPRLVNGGLRPAPPLPLEAFRSLQGYIADLAASKGAPADYMAVALLAGSAGVMGAARVVSLRPNWTEYGALWMLSVGGPSTAKTQPFSVIERAIRQLEREEAPDFEAQLAKHKEAVEVAKLCDAVWAEKAKKALKGGFPAPDRPAEATPPPEPQRPRMVVSDATTEALSRLFANNPRGLILLRDEAAAWLGGFGKYGGDGDAGFYLSTFNGIFAPVDRVKAGGSLQADRALLSFAGGIQPDRFHGMLVANRDDDGMVARFLPVWPDPAPPVWKVRFADETQVVGILRRLRQLRMAEDETGGTKPVALKLSTDAEATFSEWWVGNTNATRATTGLLAGFLGKGNGVVARLALVLEMLEWAGSAEFTPEPTEVTEASVLAALRLYEDYFVPMALRVYGDAKRPAEERNAVALLREALRRGVRKINAREAQRTWRVPGLSEAEPVRAALEALVEGDCVRQAGIEGGGRPRGDYLLNPRLQSEALSA